MKRIILDTDFILHCLRAKVDIIRELNRICDFKFRVCVLDKTLDELKGKKDSRLAVEFIKKIDLIKTRSNKKVDDLLLEFKQDIVATGDKGLKEKLKNRKIALIVLRQKKYLFMKNVF